MDERILRSTSRKAESFSVEKRALSPSPGYTQAVMDTLKADVVQAVKDKRLVHLPPGASGVVDFMLYVSLLPCFNPS